MELHCKVSAGRDSRHRNTILVHQVAGYIEKDMEIHILTYRKKSM